MFVWLMQDANAPGDLRAGVYLVGTDGELVPYAFFRTVAHARHWVEGQNKNIPDGLPLAPGTDVDESCNVCGSDAPGERVAGRHIWCPPGADKGDAKRGAP